MSDLVERLRTVGIGRNFKIFAVCEEAAARIEALEAALREIDNMAPATCEVTLAHQMADCARAALDPESK